MFRPFFLSLVAVAASTIAHGADLETLNHNGIERSYLIERPKADGPAPALVVFHGGGGKSEQTRRYTGFTLSERGWVEIYPQGLDRKWNDGRQALKGGSLHKADDIGFIRSLLEQLIRDRQIDPDRIFFTGPSNGGAMTQRMACEAPDLVAGAASVIMTFPIGLNCPKGPAVPLMLVLGTEDPLVPFEGGPVTLGRRDRGAVRSASETFTFYADRNGCGQPLRTELPDSAPSDGMLSHRLDWQDCAAPLTAVITEKGGHNWPGTPSRRVLRRILGETTQDFSATHLIEAFFRQIARR